LVGAVTGFRLLVSSFRFQVLWRRRLDKSKFSSHIALEKFKEVIERVEHAREQRHVSILIVLEVFSEVRHGQI
jgi:hypothetical protein